MTTGGGRFDFDDGGSYIGGWQDGKAHGLGLCTGPKGQGEFAGEWTDGFESCGVYIWPSGNTYEGMWTKGKRHGEGVETKGRWIYKGEWTTGFKGRYGVREALTSAAKYEGSWVTGMQDGYGVETYADGGTYSGQWLRGTRNGYGVRTSAPFEAASCYRDERYLRESLTSIRSIDESENIVKDREKKQEEARGGFVLKAVGDESPTARRKSIFEKKSSLKKTFLGKLKKQRSTGDICESPRGGRSGGSIRSAYSNVSDASAYTDNLHVPTNVALGRNPVNNIPSGCIETYRGEWKNDKRSGFGLCERTDGLRYEGEWFNNKKNGYGVTTFPDGGTEEGKYKNDTLITASGKKPKLFVLRTSKIRERVEAAVQQARQANQMGVQKAEMAANRY